MTAKPRPSIEELIGPTKRPVGRPPSKTSDRLNIARAVVAELQAEKLRRELVPAVEVEREWAAIVIDLRNRLLAIPSRCAAEGVPKEHVGLIDREVRSALQALAKGDTATEVAPEAEKRTHERPGAATPQAKPARGRRK